MAIRSLTVYLVQCNGTCHRWLSEPEGPGGPLHWVRSLSGATRYRDGENAGDAARRSNLKQGRKMRSLTCWCDDCQPK